MRFFASALIALTLVTVGHSAPVSNPSDGGVVRYTQCNRPGVYALTYDDGPFEYSWDLAKYLNSRGVNATFFTNSHNYFTSSFSTTTTPTKSDGPKTYNEVLQLYNQLGHEIGSHTYEHKNLVGLTDAQVRDQLNKQSDIIFNAIGKRPALFRPPNGDLTDLASNILKELGYSAILWDVDSKDFEGKGFSYERGLISAVIDKDVKGKTLGHIALQHDVHSESAVELTPWVVDYILAKGYTFVTVSDCLGISAYH